MHRNRCVTLMHSFISCWLPRDIQARNKFTAKHPSAFFFFHEMTNSFISTLMCDVKTTSFNRIKSYLWLFYISNHGHVAQYVYVWWHYILFGKLHFKMSLNHRNITSYNVGVIIKLGSITSTNGSVNMTISRYHWNIYFSVFTNFFNSFFKILK